jgi:hypothetical protein
MTAGGQWLGKFVSGRGVEIRLGQRLKGDGEEGQECNERMLRLLGFDPD